jgi:hypothetical protein
MGCRLRAAVMKIVVRVWKVFWVVFRRWVSFMGSILGKDYAKRRII